MSLRDELVALIEGWGLELPGVLEDDTSLVRSGLFDSLALFNLALWIEGKTGAPLDPSGFDLSREWDTISNIQAFIERRRRAGSPEAGDPPRV
jgi:acyl carrier protein